MSGYGFTNSLTVCYRKLWCFKFVAISIFMRNIKKKSFSFEFVCLCKKNDSPLLLLLNICKLYYFSVIGASTLCGWNCVRRGCHVFLKCVVLFSNLLFVRIMCSRCFDCIGTYSFNGLVNINFGRFLGGVRCWGCHVLSSCVGGDYDNGGDLPTSSLDIF